MYGVDILVVAEVYGFVLPQGYLISLKIIRYLIGDNALPSSLSKRNSSREIGIQIWEKMTKGWNVKRETLAIIIGYSFDNSFVTIQLRLY